MSKKKASAKEPFLPFFVGDFAAATAEWEGEAKSLYLTLLTHQWALGSIPAEPKRICKLVRWDWELFEVHWREVRRKFTSITVEDEDGEQQERLINARLEEHRDKTKELRGKNSASGSKGAAGKWGDRPESDHSATRAQRLAEARKKGTHQAFEWAAMLTICGPKCLKCGALAPLVKDHVTPIYQGGADSIENLQPLCKKCNCAKGPDTTDYRPVDWRERLAQVLAASGGATHIYSGTSGERLAVDGKTSGDGQTKRLANDGLTTGKTSGENVKTSGNPSHPIPSHPIHPDRDSSPQDSVHVALNAADMRARDEKSRYPNPPPSLTVELTEAEHHDRFVRLMAGYPEFVGAAKEILVEKLCRQLIDDGQETWDTLEAHRDRFAKFVQAGGRSEPKYVETPLTFFGDASMRRDPWRPPRRKSEQRTEANLDAAEQAKRELMQEFQS